MKTINLFSLFCLLAIFTGCNRADPNNSRAYIEGNIQGNQLVWQELKIRLISQHIVAEAVPDDSGKFILSGPVQKGNMALKFDRKIKSFQTDRSGCTLSADSSQITIPEGITYLRFNEITIK